MGHMRIMLVLVKRTLVVTIFNTDIEDAEVDDIMLIVLLLIVKTMLI